MCFAMLLSLTGEGFVIAEICYGGGRHVEELGPEVYTAGLKMNTLSTPMYVVAISVVKISVGCTLMRLAGHTRWRYLIMPIMITMWLWAFSSIFVSQPHRHEESAAVWAERLMSSQRSGHCVSMRSPEQAVGHQSGRNVLVAAGDTGHQLRGRNPEHHDRLHLRHCHSGAFVLPAKCQPPQTHLPHHRVGSRHTRLHSLHHEDDAVVYDFET